MIRSPSECKLTDVPFYLRDFSSDLVDRPILLYLSPDMPQWTAYWLTTENPPVREFNTKLYLQFHLFHLDPVLLAFLDLPSPPANQEDQVLMRDLPI